MGLLKANKEFSIAKKRQRRARALANKANQNVGMNPVSAPSENNQKTGELQSSMNPLKIMAEHAVILQQRFNAEPGDQRIDLTAGQLIIHGLPGAHPAGIVNELLQPLLRQNQHNLLITMIVDEQPDADLCTPVFMLPDFNEIQDFDEGVFNYSDGISLDIRFEAKIINQDTQLCDWLIAGQFLLPPLSGIAKLTLTC
ncbi:MAG: hypothetical protein IBX50_11955 [Marinospirillum sp.]|uniref:hypothetical protein n=1 Tax=Marinospirillum sp. TaxID=2183934 RepID=UPI0019EBBF46|nr:hypothetical protein [Marinospirillum sp.]MBE0507412.1 hypothetical protein [Marinospirillum sp.]